MANKLKNLHMTSVDFVKRGANQDADIKLCKSADGFQDDNIQIIMKSDEEIQDMIQKSEDTMSLYAEALVKSITSALNDSSMNDEEAQAFMEKSLSEFDEAVKSDIISEFRYAAAEPGIAKKSYTESEDTNMANLGMLNIDKSALTPEESAQLESLLEKACGKKPEDMTKECGKGKRTVTKEDDMEDDMEEDDDFPPVPPKKDDKGAKEMRKSAPIHPAVQAALDRMETLAKGMEMKNYMEIAKKYEVLGEDTEKLAKSLYDMKQQGDDTYNSYIAVLDKSLDILNKSGMFGEIGKSAYGPVGTGYRAGIQKSDAESKIETIAKGYMDKDPSLTVAAATARAWENHPELAVEYENSRM